MQCSGKGQAVITTNTLNSGRLHKTCTKKKRHEVGGRKKGVGRSWMDEIRE